MTTNTITLYPFGLDRTTTPTIRAEKNQSGSSRIDVYTLSCDEEMSVDEMFAQLESSDPRAAAAAEVGTKWVAQTFLADHHESLAVLRIRAGLSQRALANRLGVSQPLIAKWERDGEPNMQLNTVKKLANALSVDLFKLVEILVNEH